MDPELSRPNQHQLSPNSLTNLRLKKVLKSYQQCAPDSLSGPNYYNPTWINGDHGLKYSGDKYTSNAIVTSPYSTSTSHNIKANSNNNTNNNISSKSNNNYLTNINTNSNSSNNNISTSKHNNNNSSNNKNHNTSSESQVSSVNSQHLSCSSSLGSTNGLSHSNGPSLINSGEGGGRSSSSNSSNNINISTGGREKASRGSGESPTPVTKSSNLPLSSSSSSSLSSTSSSLPVSTTGSDQIAPNLRIPPPIIIPADPNSCQRSETILEDEVISCFDVGGEKRLCLPQILNTVLTDFSLQQINSVCDELHIFCSRCTPEQLEVLKVTGILPASAPSCGLITKTDAERLCAALLFYASRHKMILGSTFHGSGIEFDDLGSKCESIDIEKLGPGIPVCHECFGTCSGTVYTDLYIEPTSRCIKCSECKTWLTPQRFVTHIHSSTENHICHWGFDSYNWRAYIHLDEESKEYQLADVEQLEAELDSFKSRFDPTVIGLSCNNSPAANKRKLEQSNKSQTEKKDDYDKQTNNLNRGQLPEPLKKIKTEEMPTMKQSPLDLLSPHPYSYFPVSTNWTPDPSVFNYWYHHPYVTQPPVSGLASLPLPQPTVSISTNQQNHPQQQSRVTVEHKSLSNEDDEPESNKVQEKHLFSNLDKLLRRNKINRDLRVQIFKEIENILEEVRSTGDVDIKPS